MSPHNPLRDLTPTEADLDENTQTASPKDQETLREKAAKSLHGPDANPSQLGDPISLKAEASDTNPTPNEAGTSSSSSPHPSNGSSSSTNSSKGSSTSGGGEKLREKAAKQLHGPGANPSQLGDPVSLKAETSENVPAPSEEGVQHGSRGVQRPRSRL